MVQLRGLKGAAAPLFSKVSSGFFYGSLEPIFSFQEKTGLRKKRKTRVRGPFFLCHPNALGQLSNLEHKPAIQRSDCGLEAKKHPVRLRDPAARRGLVPKGAFLSWCR